MTASGVTFGRLADLPPRQAWANEARDFTPWLAANIDQLSEVIGMPLEMTGTEVAVESFAADILARNAADGTVVLIENQLEATDHTHLGQILTYLAGLEAQTVVWIAPSFRAPHLSAIRWLNTHTTDGFAFFAVKVRVVRIGDSPFAPVFEVVEKPNDWDREMRQKATSDGAAYYDIKAAFWSELLARHPHLAAAGVRAWRYPNTYVGLATEPVVDLSIWIGRSDCGVYLRGGRGAGPAELLALLEPHRSALEQVLGAPLDPNARGHVALQRHPIGHEDRDQWPAAMDWIARTVDLYIATLGPILAGEGP